MEKDELIDKELIYSMASLGFNLCLISGLFEIGIGLIAFILKGNLQLFIKTLIFSGSWILLALAGKFYFKRARKRILTAYNYLLLYVTTAINLLLWLKFPTNIILMTLTLIMTIYSFIFTRRKYAQKSREEV